MTQEELNELIEKANFEEPSNELSEDDYKVNTENKWPPPPPTDSHKVVHQLDDVTRGIEIKATQIFDELESISNSVEIIQKNIKELIKNVEENQSLFEKLQGQFPNIKAFSNSLQLCKQSLDLIKNINEAAQSCSDSSLSAMDIMQYQDIHRQKIERVVNVMRAVAKYLNSILDTEIDDSKRTSSAKHLDGDESEIMNDSDIEALIAKLQGS